MKSGIKTSEFWLTLLTQLSSIALLWMVWRGDLVPTFEYAEELLLGVIIGSQTVYTNSRTKLKNGNG